MEQEEGEVYEEEDPPARGLSILQYLRSEDEKGDAAGKLLVTVDKKDCRISASTGSHGAKTSSLPTSSGPSSFGAGKTDM